MKLKRLNLRNIASIVKADIDFEHGLKDAVSGERAGIFLITGETGSGKSVILDGIAMALYKKTPRLAGVTNVKDNKYRGDNGTEVGINSIEQYTRIGISQKDDCYSEVVFEGNDGREHAMRLKLGYTMSRKEKRLRYSTPVWEIRHGDEGYVKVTGSMSDEIADLIGLTFTQFCRMSMLPQGEFASFMTGDKKERESILERLTDTAIFSRYGEAIKTLYARKKQLSEMATMAVEQEERNALGEETVQTLAAERANLEKEQETVNKRIAAVDRRLDILGKMELDRNSQASAMETLGQLGEEYTLLCDDLEARTRHAADAKKATAELMTRIEAQKERSAVYARQPEISLHLGNLVDLRKESGEIGPETDRLKQAAPGLKLKVKEAAERLAEAEKAADGKQKEIDAVKASLEELRPVEIRDSLMEVKAGLSRCEALSGRLGALKGDLAALDNAEKILAERESEFVKLAALRDNELKVLSEARQRADEAKGRLATMEMSVSDILVSLRHKMHDEKTGVCPLCGQGVTFLPLDDQFEKLITPFEEEKRRAAALLETAERQASKVVSDCDKAQGNLDAMKQTLGKDRRKVAGELKECVKLASSAGVADADNAGDAAGAADAVSRVDALHAAVAHRMEKLAESEKAISARQAEADKLQKRINVLLDERKPLDKAKNGAATLKDAAEKALADHDEQLSVLMERSSVVESNIKKIRIALADSISAMYPDWDSDPAGVSRRIEAEAEAYHTLCKEYERMEAEDARFEECSARICGYKRDIEEQTTGWAPQPAQSAERDDSGRAAPMQDGEERWRELSGNVKVAAALAASARKGIEEKMAALSNLASDGLADLSEEELRARDEELYMRVKEVSTRIGIITERLDADKKTCEGLKNMKLKAEAAKADYLKWHRLNELFGGTRFRTLVQTHILRPLLNNANIYLQRITDRYRLTCSPDNEQLSIFVLDRYNKDCLRSMTVLSGGERFMISLALSLALSSLNKPDMNVDILFIDEGFGTLDEKTLDSVMTTLERLQEIAGQTGRRVGIISHREELAERIPVKICVRRAGEGRSEVRIEQ